MKGIVGDKNIVNDQISKASPENTMTEQTVKLEGSDQTVLAISIISEMLSIRGP